MEERIALLFKGDGSMSMDKPIKNQSLHDKLIIIQAVNYKKQGYTNIKVNHINYLLGQPDKVGSFTPDLSAVLNNKTTICNIETKNSIHDTETIEKWKAFDRSNYIFHLIIPNTTLTEVKDIAKSNGITVDKYWFSKGY
jgi:hypothetical protein